MPITIRELANQLNVLAGSYKIGELQEIRKDLKGFQRRPGSTIFSTQTVHDEWACHHGGRSELQFNIGLEFDGAEVRHGVAFSFETSQSLPSIDALTQKAGRLGEFIRDQEHAFADMRMWHWTGEKQRRVRSSDYPAGPVMPEVAQEGTFLFLGKRQPAASVDPNAILRDFDRLLPLYCFVEGTAETSSTPDQPRNGFAFRPGCTARAAGTTATFAERKLDIGLRHNLLQDALCKELIAEFGEQNVGDEHPCGDGKAIDVVVRAGHDSFQFYEIKTGSSPRACIRDALGQLLEYAYWPPTIEPSLLVICGEPALDDDGRRYLERMAERHQLPLMYLQIRLPE